MQLVNMKPQEFVKSTIYMNFCCVKVFAQSEYYSVAVCIDLHLRKIFRAPDKSGFLIIFCFFSIKYVMVPH